MPKNVVSQIKKLDKESKLYRFLKSLYLNFFFYFVNVDTWGKPKVLYKVIGGQHVDLDQLEGFFSPKDGPVVDVGAERGDVSRHFLKHGFKVYAVEPEKKNVLYLWLHYFFRVITGRLRILRYACGETGGTAKLYVSDLSFRHSLEQSQYTRQTFQEVKVVRLGDLLEKLGLNKISLLKIDAEGFDLPILKGFFASAKIPPKAIMFEAGPDNVRELVELVQKNGYKYFRFICRWDEQESVVSQKRIAVYDGLDPEVFAATSSNVICLREDFRVLHPVVVNN